MVAEMKNVIFLTSWLLVGLLQAKWAPLNEAGLILNATDVLVADYVSMEEKGEAQEASFKVVEVWKGGAIDVVKVRGVTRFICAPVVNFSDWKKGRYLLILREKDGLYDPFNGGFSVVLITEGKLSWFAEEEGQRARRSMDLVKVKEKIAAVLNKAELDKGTAKAKLEKGL
jgi:hypothetical protein